MVPLDAGDLLGRQFFTPCLRLAAAKEPTSFGGLAKAGLGLLRRQSVETCGGAGGLGPLSAERVAGRLRPPPEKT